MGDLTVSGYLGIFLFIVSMLLLFVTVYDTINSKEVPSNKHEELYTRDMVGSGQFGICNKCGKPPTEEGHDGCLGTLQGDIMNACCGHGKGSQAYIQYWGGGLGLRGRKAITEQLRLIKERDGGNKI